MVDDIAMMCQNDPMPCSGSSSLLTGNCLSSYCAAIFWLPLPAAWSLPTLPKWVTENLTQCGCHSAAMAREQTPCYPVSAVQ